MLESRSDCGDDRETEHARRLLFTCERDRGGASRGGKMTVRIAPCREYCSVGSELRKSATWHLEETILWPTILLHGGILGIKRS
jgi:hypothetical protein